MNINENTVWSSASPDIVHCKKGDFVYRLKVFIAYCALVRWCIQTIIGLLFYRHIFVTNVSNVFFQNFSTKQNYVVYVA